VLLCPQGFLFMLLRVHTRRASLSLQQAFWSPVAATAAFHAVVDAHGLAGWGGGPFWDATRLSSAGAPRLRLWQRGAYVTQTRCCADRGEALVWTCACFSSAALCSDQQPVGFARWVAKRTMHACCGSCAMLQLGYGAAISQE
jgi:hypothetical protein